MNSLLNNNGLDYSDSQRKALTSLESFLCSEGQIFILKGYAGSGKTTIIKGLVEYLKENKKVFMLMAPTGRAAKILREKTANGKTIHSSIYNFEKLESKNQEKEDESEHSFHYHFPIDANDTNDKLIIVDEASMVSAKESKNELFTFGTGNLLHDLLTFARLKSGISKLIFVGDPAQLPPVTDNKSLALDASYLRTLGYSVEETEMKEVLRQGNNLILENATKIRELLNIDKRTELIFSYDQNSFIKLGTSDIISKYIDSYPIPEFGNGVIISFSNAQCYHYNVAVREKIFPGKTHIGPGDLLLINGNNYHTYGVELYNGDFVKVIDVASDIQLQSAPVFIKELKKKVNIQLKFRKVTIRVPSHQENIHCLILENLLHSVDRDLSIEEMNALYVNFVMRFNAKQKLNKEAGLDYFKVGSEEFRQELKKDPFFNALKVKFGYAITCHKAQGGEWDKVFIDYSGRVGLSDHPLRWTYTATTRGINTVFAYNAPHFGKLSKLKFSAIGNIGTLPNEALTFDNISLSPFHNNSHHKGKSAKYWEILEKIENTAYKILKVETKDYLERYTIAIEDHQIILQASNRNSGHFIEPFKVLNPKGEAYEKELDNLINKRANSIYFYSYQPEEVFLSDLHSMMQECCSAIDVTITNVIKGKQNYINYYLITDSICSYIQFYYNNSSQLTTAMPKTFQCENDNKLKTLILKLSEYAG